MVIPASTYTFAGPSKGVCLLYGGGSAPILPRGTSKIRKEMLHNGFFVLMGGASPTLSRDITGAWMIVFFVRIWFLKPLNPPCVVENDTIFINF